MSKDNVVIEEGGMRFVFEKDSGLSCLSCKARGYCREESFIHNNCDQSNRMDGYHCIYATKIQPEPQPEPKMYFAWNREEARHLVGKMVESHGGSCYAGWTATKLLKIDNIEAPFLCDNGATYIIREIPTTKLTLAQLIEMAGIEGDVEIVEE